MSFRYHSDPQVHELVEAAAGLLVSPLGWAPGQRRWCECGHEHMYKPCNPKTKDPKARHTWADCMDVECRCDVLVEDRLAPVRRALEPFLSSPSHEQERS